MIKGIIFDLDGTLIDSEGNYYKADKIFLKKYGVDYTFDMQKEWLGKGGKALIEWLKTINDIDKTAEELLQEKDEIYLSIALENTQVFPEMQKLLDELEEQKIIMAIASGSPNKIIDDITEKLKLQGYFKTMVSASEVKNSKPAPDVFLETLRRINLSQEEVVVIEDSKSGIGAALNAKIKCAAIPSLPELGIDEIFYKADILFENGHKDFSAEKFLDWIQKVN